VRRLLLAVVLSAIALPAVELPGFWMGSVSTGRRNTVIDFAFQFVQKGSELTGKLYLDYGTVPILKGVVEGDKISFEVVAREQAGNEIQEAVYKFTGVMKDGELEMTRERQELRNTVNAAAGFTRQNTPLTFKLKRLK
jgi:hypothetical protein